MARPKRDAPKLSSPNWPSEACTDPIAEVLRQIAVNLRRAIGGQSVRSAAETARVDHSVVHDLLAGNSWPEVSTVARLEIGLNTSLWPVG